VRESRRRRDHRAEWPLFTEQSIGMTLAVRNLMHDLRSGRRDRRAVRRPFRRGDRSAFSPLE